MNRRLQCSFVIRQNRSDVLYIVYLTVVLLLQCYL